MTAASRPGSPAHVPVALDAHRVAGRVQSLRADHDRVEVEVLLVRVPAAVVDPAEQAEQVERVDAAAPGDPVLAVGREGVVLGRRARPEPTWAASWPSRLAQIPSSPWRCSAVASASTRRTSTRSR